MSNSQDVFIDGLQWEYNMTSFSDPTLRSNKLRIIGDTVIQRKDCKILEREFVSCNSRPKREYLYMEDQQVYYYHFNDRKFQPLYDFSLEVGDTTRVRLWGPYLSRGDYMYIKIDSIGSIDFNGHELKDMYYYFGYENNLGEVKFSYWKKFRIIEGVGETDNLFYFVETGFCHGLYVDDLRCFYHPEYGYLNLNNDECSIITSSKDYILEKSSYRIYPNPTKGNIEIIPAENLKMETISILDCTGKTVLENSSIKNKNQLKLNIESLTTGLYILRIKTEDDLIFNERIIKQ